jgi:hypothetical protein
MNLGSIRGGGTQIMSILALGPDLPPMRCVHIAGFSPGGALPSGAEVKNEWNYASTPPYVFVACLIKREENFL